MMCTYHCCRVEILNSLGPDMMYLSGPLTLSDRFTNPPIFFQTNCKYLIENWFLESENKLLKYCEL